MSSRSFRVNYEARKSITEANLLDKTDQCDKCLPSWIQMLWENSQYISRYWRETIMGACMDEVVFDLSLRYEECIQD